MQRASAAQVATNSKRRDHAISLEKKWTQWPTVEKNAAGAQGCTTSLPEWRFLRLIDS